MAPITRPLRHYARVYTDRLYAGRSLDESLMARLKNDSFRVLSFILHQPAPAFRLIGPRVCPSVESLARKLPTAFTDSLATEYHWATAVLVASANELTAFYGLRNAFETALLMGNFERAEAALADTEATLGHSFWVISSRLLLAEQAHGLSANRTQLSQYCEAAKSTWPRLFATLFSERCEKTLCPDAFEKTWAHLTSEPPDNDVLQSRFAAYIRYRLNRARVENEGSLPYLLHLEESHSSVDRLAAYSFVSTSCFLRGDFFEVPSLRDDLAYVLRYIPNGDLMTIGALVGAVDFSPSQHESQLFEVIDLYTRGRYADAAEVILPMLQARPTVYELYELAAKSVLRAGLPLPDCFADGTLAHEILSSLYSLFSRSPDLTSACHTLRKLGYRLNSTAIGPALLSLYTQTVEDTYPARDAIHWVLQATEPTPRLALAFPTPGHALTYLTRLARAFPGNASVSLFYDVANNSLSPASGIASVIPFSRRLKYCAARLERDEKFPESLALYEEMRIAEVTEGSQELHTLVGTMRCLLRLGRVKECVVKLVRTAARRPTVIPIQILKQLIASHSEPIQTELSATLEWPVLRGMSHRYGLAPASEEEMHAFVDDYLSAVGVRRPTELRDAGIDVDVPTLIYFLRYVCTPDVLEASPWYESLAELMSERIAICEWLSELDSTNQPVYVTEVANLRRAGAMRELSQKIGQSKIFVDTQRIRDHLPEPYMDRVTRCLAYLQELTDALRQTLQVLGVPLANLRRMPVKFVDASFDMFKDLFGELTQQFTSSNEWGLDSNLSQRIRHGVLSGELRPLFESHHLITHLDAAGEYLPNEHWIERLCGLQSDQRDEVSEVLDQLSARLDKMVAEVRNSWLQIRSSTKATGFFDFDFSDDELHAIMFDASQADSPASFVARAFDALWQRTDANLEKVRIAITETLRDQLWQFLDESLASLEQVLGIAAVTDYRNTVTSAKTQLQAKLVNIANWFHVDHPERMSDFDLGTLADAVIDTVKYSGVAQMDVNCSVDSSEAVPGRYFRSLWDLCFILLDNCARHSLKSPSEVEVRMAFAWPRIHLLVGNKLGAAVDRTALGERAASMSGSLEIFGDLTMLRREGGSGLLKLHKILRFDMDSHDYVVSLKLCDPDTFEANISAALQ